MFSTQLIALARYMAGELDNQAQAIADPAWYVHLRLWQRPVPLFIEDSLTLYAEQANIVKLDRPYRPRIIRLKPNNESQTSFQAQYYMIKDISSIKGAASNPALLKTLTADAIELLPGCALTVNQVGQTPHEYHFQAFPPANSRCCFTYEGQTYQVSLGFEASPDEFLSYDKGIEPETGKALWGAMMGPFRFKKRQDFSSELAI